MATCEDLGLKVLQQNPQARSEWGRLAREGHDVWQVLHQGRYLGVIVDGVYHSYQEIGRAHRVPVNMPHVHWDARMPGRRRSLRASRRGSAAPSPARPGATEAAA